MCSRDPQPRPLPVTSQKLSRHRQAGRLGERIARLIEFDEALSANILRVANSSAYANLIRLDEIGRRSCAWDQRRAPHRLGTT